MELMKSNGQVVVISCESNEYLFKAACLSLGSLGIILTVTVQCEPSFNLRFNSYPAKLQDVSTLYTFRCPIMELIIRPIFSEYSTNLSTPFCFLRLCQLTCHPLLAQQGDRCCSSGPVSNTI